MDGKRQSAGAWDQKFISWAKKAKVRQMSDAARSSQKEQQWKASQGISTGWDDTKYHLGISSRTICASYSEISFRSCVSEGIYVRVQVMPNGPDSLQQKVHGTNSKQIVRDLYMGDLHLLLR